MPVIRVIWYSSYNATLCKWGSYVYKMRHTYLFYYVYSTLLVLAGAINNFKLWEQVAFIFLEFLESLLLRRFTMHCILAVPDISTLEFLMRDRLLALLRAFPRSSQMEQKPESSCCWYSPRPILRKRRVYGHLTFFYSSAEKNYTKNKY